MTNKKLSPLDENAGVYITQNADGNCQLIVNGIDISGITADVHFELSAIERKPYVWVRLIAPELVADLKDAILSTAAGTSLPQWGLEKQQEIMDKQRAHDSNEN